jgi:putative drug exporter of the RND superfamily
VYGGALESPSGSSAARAAWWLPRWLDRTLPNLDIEGAKLRRLPGSQPSAAQPAPADPQAMATLPI